MKGLLADVNIQGWLPGLQVALTAHDMSAVLAEFGLSLFVFRDFNLPRDLNDRELWNFCQREKLVLLTDNRNHDGENSLQATLDDSLREDSLPVLTPGDKGRLYHDREYQSRVALSIAEVMFGVAQERRYLGCGRLFLPLAGES